LPADLRVSDSMHRDVERLGRDSLKKKIRICLGQNVYRSVDAVGAIRTIPPEVTGSGTET